MTPSEARITVVGVPDVPGTSWKSSRDWPIARSPST